MRTTTTRQYYCHRLFAAFPAAINTADITTSTMCGTKISYACSTTLISQSITCGCDTIVARGKSTLYCGTCSHPRCKELRGELAVRA